MVHRFIRLKDVDNDRKVLMENAVERYLVELEEMMSDVFHGTEKEQRVVYSCLNEDSHQPLRAAKSYTFLMVIKETHSKAALHVPENLRRASQMTTLYYSEMNQEYKVASFWAREFLRFT